MLSLKNVLQHLKNLYEFSTKKICILTSDSNSSMKPESAVFIEAWYLKNEGAYFKERGITHIKFQNFVVFFLKTAKKHYLYDL